MEKSFLELESFPPRMFEITSERKLPSWLLSRVVTELYRSSSVRPSGIAELTITKSNKLPIRYYTRDPLISAFVSETPELDLWEAVLNFRGFFHEGEVSPYNIVLTKISKTSSPEEEFKRISDQIVEITKELCLISNVKIEPKPNISYYGDKFEAEFSLPLDSQQRRRLVSWASSNQFILTIRKAPLQEKSS